MSDSAKPEEKPIVPESPKAAEEIPAPSEQIPEAGMGEVSPVVADAPAEETIVEEKREKPEPKEITHGTLAKAHGGLLAFFKQKRFFYFQDEPISEDKLKVYLHKETSSRSTAAYASQTGKGLLLYSKSEGQKEVPHGIIKLADVTDIIPVGVTKFILKLAPHTQLHFESPPAERDSWVFTLNHKISEAKVTSEEIINSEGYKSAFDKLRKPTAIVATNPKEADIEEATNTETKTDKDDVTSTPSGAEEEAGSAAKKADPKRSPSSRSRVGFFAYLGRKIGPEEKQEDITEKKEEEQTGEVKPTGQEAVPSAVHEDVPAEVKGTTEVSDADPAVAPKSSKRNSILEAFTRDKKEKEVEEEKRDKLKNGAIAKTTDKETEVKPSEVTEALAETTEITPVVAVDGLATPDVTSPATSPREQKRKSAFFSFKKDKKSDDVKSDSEDTEPTQKPGPTSPLPKAGAGILNLMRRASKSARHAGKEPESKDVAAPETVSEERAPFTIEDVKHTTACAESTEPTSTSIGDVVPEAVSVGQPPVQATA